ncbi:uncharacterized protein LOC117645888 [Thrips palmi]|uniref:Uncharacterized protein LOC117645888 n=1 Tax=Thrips palmi TaxID=161013 RepID=A0A6P8ZNG6_THRPL|nr:uncharacterized protein LOC117645888 [Thrips palmi]
MIGALAAGIIVPPEVLPSPEQLPAPELDPSARIPTRPAPSSVVFPVKENRILKEVQLNPRVPSPPPLPSPVSVVTVEDGEILDRSIASSLVDNQNPYLID